MRMPSKRYESAVVIQTETSKLLLNVLSGLSLVPDAVKAGIDNEDHTSLLDMELT